MGAGFRAILGNAIGPLPLSFPVVELILDEGVLIFNKSQLRKRVERRQRVDLLNFVSEVSVVSVMEGSFKTQ